MKEVEEYKGYQIKIESDDYPDSPRDWDNLGTMVCGHRHYNLGDEQIDSRYGDPYYDGVPVQDFLKRKDIVWLPLYLYDHSGITISTSSFSCSWDSGQVGFIYVTKEDILKEYGGKIVTKKKRELALQVLRGEVETYDQYLTGDVYWFGVEKDDEILDSCGGCYGYKYALQEAKSYIDYHIKQEEKREWESLTVKEELMFA